MVDAKAELEAVSVFSHLAYGAACGAAYSYAERIVAAAPTIKGIIFGLAVWSGSYLGWLPFAGIRASAADRPQSETAMMVASHIVFGMFLGKWTTTLTDE